MDSLGARLEKHLDETGISQAELARLSGVKQQTISYIIRSGARSSAYATRLAMALGVNPYWLQDGTGHPFDPAVEVGSEGSHKVRAHWVPKRKMSELNTGFKGEPATGEVAVTSVEVSANAFAVDVVGRAMDPLLQEGDELIVDPNLMPEPGDYVLAVVDGVAVLRKWRPVGRGGAFELVAANPDFPLLQCGNDEPVLAVVVEHRRKMRR